MADDEHPSDWELWLTLWDDDADGESFKLPESGLILKRKENYGGWALADPDGQIQDIVYPERWESPRMAYSAQVLSLGERHGRLGDDEPTAPPEPPAGWSQ